MLSMALEHTMWKPASLSTGDQLMEMLTVSPGVHGMASTVWLTGRPSLRKKLNFFMNLWKPTKNYTIALFNASRKVRFFKYIYLLLVFSVKKDVWYFHTQKVWYRPKHFWKFAGEVYGSGFKLNINFNVQQKYMNLLLCEGLA